MGGRRLYRPRWVIWLALLTLPIWFLPSALLIGVKEMVPGIIEGMGQRRTWRYLFGGSPQ